MQDDDSRARWIVLALIFAGALLRLYHLGFKSLWVDEANLYWLSRGSLAQVLEANAHGNSAPPLFALALAWVSRLAESEAGLRALSCAAGIAAIPVAYLLAREFLGARPALVAAFLTTLSPGQIVYSQQVREYSLAFLLTAVILLFYVRCLRAPSWRTWVALTGSMVVGLFTQYGIGLLLVALNAVAAGWWLAGGIPFRTFVRWSLSQIPALAAAALVLRVSLQQQFDAAGFGARYLERGYWSGSADSLRQLLLGGTYDIFFLAFPTALLLEFLVALGLARAWRERQGRLAVLLFAAPLLVTFAAALLRYYPYLGMRQCLFLTVMIYVIAAYGVQALLEVERRGLVAAVVVAWLAFHGAKGSWEYLETTEPFHLRPAVEALHSGFRAGDRIYVYHGAASPFRYYDRRAPHVVEAGMQPGGRAEFLAQVDRLLSTHGRVWFVTTTCRSGECALLRRHVSERHAVRDVVSGSGAELYVVENNG